jgi:hypothetical protein
MSFVDLMIEILRLISSYVGLAIQLHAEKRQTRAKREENATKKDDDRQSKPQDTIIIIVVFRGKE